MAFRTGVAAALSLVILTPLWGSQAMADRVKTATAATDQDVANRRALAAIETDVVKQARELAEYRWKAVLRDEPPAQGWHSFNAMMDDYMFNYAMKAANSDPNHPMVVTVYTPPHKRGGVDLPGSRWGGDNPDNVYRIIPIDSKARYRLDGKRSSNPPANVSYTLVGNWETSKTLNGIEDNAMEYRPDGSFSITLDPEPANGRANHIQTKPGSLLLFIRDSLGDWDETANALEIHRLDPPDSPPLTDAQIAARTAEIAVDGVPQVYWYYKLSHGEPNSFAQFSPSGSRGGLVSQRAVSSYAVLEDDEAIVMTMYPSDASYYSVVACSYWWLSIDFPNHTSSMNNGQVVKNEDGTVTFVVAPRDPGVHNWVDTDGQNHVVLTSRAQGLSAKPEREPTLETRIVKASELKSILPPETKWVTPDERAAQIAKRQQQIARRLSAD